LDYDNLSCFAIKLQNACNTISKVTPMNNSELEFDKYIECPCCKIGGYDLCPDCHGGGGYSIKVKENPAIGHSLIVSSRLAAINKRLDLLSGKSSVTLQVEQILHNHFLELSNSSYNIHVADTLERLIKIRRTFSHQRKIKEIKKHLTDVRKIVINLEESRVQELLADMAFRVRQRRQLPFKNDFFEYRDEIGLVVKVKEGKCAKLSLQLLDNLIYNLYRHSLMDLDALQCTFDKEFEKRIVEAAYRKAIFKVQTSSYDTFRSFLIEETTIQKVINSYFIELQKKNVNEWQYL
jgi:hypothetical protein